MIVNSSNRLLIVDDDMKYCRLITDYLGGFGFEVTAVHQGELGVETACNQQWQVVVLDVMLPGIDGFEILRRIRERGSTTPVLMLTALGDEADRIVGLELGADDYVPKTSSPRELLARLRAVLRRSQMQQPTPEQPNEVVVVGELQISMAERVAYINEEALPLTPVEFDLLVVLVQSRGRVKSRAELLNEIRDRNYDVFDRSIDVHISSLRRKLDDDPKNPTYIRTVRSVGYMLINPEKRSGVRA